MKTTSRILCAFLALVLMTGLLSPAQATGMEAIGLSLAFSQDSVRVGEAVELTLTADNAFASRGSGMTLAYDPAFLTPDLEASSAAARVASEINAQLKHDMDAYTRLFSSRQSKTATKVANTANDTYLRTSGDSSGIRSYGEVVDLLVSWHYQKEILPKLTQQEQKFDPYDEKQVDLSGIVHAKPPVETTPVGGGVG